MNRTLTLAAIALLFAAPCGAAPIYGDVSVDGGIHFVSDETFRIAGFWTPEEGVAGTIDNPFEIPDPHFDGHVWRVDSIFPAQCGGTWQVDAWYHGGWWGEVRAGGDCDPPPPPNHPVLCDGLCATLFGELYAAARLPGLHSDAPV